jgi:hypothetical protein
MSATPYQPVSFNGEMITTQKMNQMANNDQWLFENSPRIRYNANGLVRDASLKVMAGKTPYPLVSLNYVYQAVYFGSFFSAGCKPVITATIEAPSGGHRNRVMIYGLTGGEVDNTGFQAVVTTEAAPTLGPAGFIHWQAVGY